MPVLPSAANTARSRGLLHWYQLKAGPGTTKKNTNRPVAFCRQQNPAGLVSQKNSAILFSPERQRAAMQQSKTSPRAASGAVLGKAVFRASQALGLTGTDLAAVIGVSPASISRLNGGQYTLSGKPFELAACLVRVFRSLDAIVHGDANSMKAWMANRNAHLNAVPREEVKTAQGLVRVMNYLDAARAPI